MNIASLVGALGAVALQPVLVGFERAQVDSIPDKRRFHQVVNVGFH